MRRADDAGSGSARRGLRLLGGLRWLALLGVATLLAAACSSGSSNVELTEDNVEDALLKADEVPFGDDWTADSSDLSGDDLELDVYEVDREACERTKADTLDAEAGATVSLVTDAFTGTAGEGVAVYEGIWVFEDGDVAEQMMEGIIAENSGRVECEDGIDNADADDDFASPVPDGVEVKKGTHCKDKGDRYACYEYESSDDAGTDYTEFDTYVRVGDAVIGLFVVDYDGDVSDDDLEKLTDNAIEKAKTAEDLGGGGS